MLTLGQISFAKYCHVSRACAREEIFEKERGKCDFSVFYRRELQARILRTIGIARRRARALTLSGVVRGVSSPTRRDCGKFDTTKNPRQWSGGSNSEGPPVTAEPAAQESPEVSICRVGRGWIFSLAFVGHSPGYPARRRRRGPSPFSGGGL